MADYVAYVNDFNDVISVDEYKINYIDKNIDVPELRCLCRNKLYYRKSSKPYQYRETPDITRYHHFYHEKGCKCNIKEILKKNNKNNSDIKTNTAKNPEEKQKIRLKNMLNYIMTNMNIYENYKATINEWLNKIELYKRYVNYDNFMTEHIKKILSLKKYLLGFRY